VTVTDRLTEITRLLATIDVDAEDVHPTELVTAVAHLATIRNRVDALDVAAIGRIDRSGQWAADGSRSLNAWLKRTSASSSRFAAQRISAARLATDMPELAAVFATGAASLEHITIVTRAVGTSPERRACLPAADPVFATLATKEGPETFKRAVDAWAQIVDDHTAADAHADRTEHAHLHASTTFDGMVAVRGLLDPETGRAFIAALAATRNKLYRNRNRDPEPADGSGVTPNKTNPRANARPSQQNVDALRYLLNLAAQHPDMATTTGGIPVHLAVTVGIDTLRGRLADHRLHPNRAAPTSTSSPAPNPEPDTDPSRRHPLLHANGDLTGTGTLIPAATARRLACDADILPIIMNSASHVLDVGRRTRLIHPALRLAIELRDEHCRFPHCDAPIQEIHHLIFWANGGRTDQTNLAGLCRHHHHTLHERGFTLTGNANTDLTLTPP